MSLPWWSWWKWRLRRLVRSGRWISWDLWGFFFPFGVKRAKLKNLIADPKLLLDIWGVMISAGRDAILWAVRLHSEVCLHGLTHLLSLFPFGNNAASSGHQKKMPSIQRGSPSKTEEQSLISPGQENCHERNSQDLEGEGTENVFSQEVFSRCEWWKPGTEAGH